MYNLHHFLHRFRIYRDHRENGKKITFSSLSRLYTQHTHISSLSDVMAARGFLTVNYPLLILFTCFAKVQNCQGHSLFFSFLSPSLFFSFVFYIVQFFYYLPSESTICFYTMCFRTIYFPYSFHLIIRSLFFFENCFYACIFVRFIFIVVLFRFFFLNIRLSTPTSSST